MSGVSMGWWQVVVLLGAGQGALLALALASRKGRPTANRLLALLMLALSAHLASTAMYGAGTLQRFPHLFGLSYPLEFAFGPLLFLYARQSIVHERALAWRDLWHAVPLLGVIAVAMPIYLMDAPAKIALAQSMIRGVWPLPLALVDPLKYVSGVVYAAATLGVLRPIAHTVAGAPRTHFRLIMALATGALVIWLVATSLAIAEYQGWMSDILTGAGSMTTEVLITVMIYAVGYAALRAPHAVGSTTGEHAAVTEPVAEVDPAPRYERSGLSDRAAQQLKERLLAYMHDARPYRRSELTLAELADGLRTTPHRLSEVLNTELEVTFYDFVNGYRVREVQERLGTPEAANLTLLALALDAGFASKSTFNAAFKRVTGQTPSTYRQGANR
ncbi:MAG: helix-turn-helix domain-containing protein [Gemmatimonadetes bacterium]|nr:helix-turn-helix domain-containing protein [Gemmatimonadota bacterium]